MYNMQLLGKTDDTIFVFSLFSQRLRIGYGVMILCITAASALVYTEQHRLPILGIVLGGVSLFVLCYVDRWRFNCTAKTVDYTVGLVFFAFTKHYAFSDIEKTETERFTKGIFHTPFIKCTLHLCTGKKETVAIFSARKEKTLERQWNTLSALLDKSAHS